MDAAFLFALSGACGVLGAVGTFIAIKYF